MEPSKVKVKCRKCEKNALAESFVLDHVYRMMVCPQCARDRTRKAESKEDASNKDLDIGPTRKPSDWDEDDKRINKEYLIKKERSPLLSGERIEVRCGSCNYSFKYHPEKRYPNLCPGCGISIRIG